MSELNKPIQIMLVSTSRFFIEGIQKILENEDGIEIAREASNLEEIKELLDESKPDFLFLDNRTLKLETDQILNWINNKRKISVLYYLQVILIIRTILSMSSI